MNTQNTQSEGGKGKLHSAENSAMQSRKAAAWICFALGVALLVHGTFLPATVGIESKVVPAIVALVFSLLFWGLMTVQNVVQLVALLKGQSASIGDKVRNRTELSKEAEDGR